MSYRKDTPLILRGINLSIPLGSKVALVGRTGSGKTSVAQALLRMVFVQGGEIKIAGRSIYTMDMLSLRRLFGVVPQFPYLFAGTIRSNIDRLGVLAEERIRSAIETVGLSYPADQAVAEGGQNLSVGERQLVCLARVIAARREIIVMDEPTSGLDPQTDARINHILKTTFSSKTVLTIAHRRESLGHYDKIVELSCGQMIKVGTASEFLREANPLGVY